MIEWNSSPQFEENIKQSFQVPAIRPEFVAHLSEELLQCADQKAKKAQRIWGVRPAWVITLAVILLLVLSTLVIGPQRVYAEVTKLLGYIPGVGIVDQSTPIRVLAEPVSLTRDGITVSVTSATLTSDKSYINFGASGVSSSAYPKGENGKGGCIEPAYLLLPDGTKMIAANEMGPLPANVNEFTLVLPCIFNTLPGTVPTNWQLPLRFVPAPQNMTVVPVIEIQPSPSPSSQANTPVPSNNPLSLTRVLDIGDHYVVMGEFNYDILGKVAHDNVFSDGSVWTIMDVKIVDANGKEIPHLPANDIALPTPSRPYAETWDYQVDKSFVPPLTIMYEAQHISPVGAQEQAKFEFNVGPNPQDGDEWTMNQDFKLGGYAIRLVSIRYSSNFGYEFQFTADPGASANWISVNLPGYTPNCGGGGGGGDDFPNEFSENFCITSEARLGKFPTGKLTGILNFQAVTRAENTFQLQWSPAVGK